LHILLGSFLDLRILGY